MNVYLTIDAELDIEEICNYIEEHDPPEAAEHIFLRLKTTILSLGKAPQRGRIVPELKRINTYEYREVFYKPYRIVYLQQDKNLYVIGIFDGRRDLQELLQARVLRRIQKT